MTPGFNEKLNDLSKWCNTACHQHKENHYHEALMNMRKSAEAFCKLVLYYRHPQKYAASAAAGKSLKELIAILKNEGVVPFEIIHSLETLQIHGNMAAHDNVVMSEHSALALSSLRLVVRWLFDSLLKIPVQPAFKELLEIKTVVNEKKQESDKTKHDELQKLKSEKSELEKQIERMKQSSLQETERFDQLSEQLKKSSEQIERINQSIISKEEQAVKAETEKETPVISPEPLPVIQKKNYRKQIIAAVIALLFIAGIYATWKKFTPAQNNIAQKVVPVVTIDSVDAVILPFPVLQDNPNINLKLEELLLNNLRQAVVQFNIPIRINFDTSLRMAGVNFTDMETYAVRSKNEIIISGDLFERNSSDSNSVAMKILMSKNENKKNTQIDLGSFSFIRPTDSNALMMTKHCMNILQIAAADYYVTARPQRISNATAILYQTYPLNSIEAAMKAKLLGNCLIIQKKYPEAETEIKKYLAMYPKDEEVWQALGSLYEVTKVFDKAESCYKKAIALTPCNVNALLTYAVFLTYSKVNRLNECQENIHIALRCDSTNPNGWLLLGEIEEAKRNLDGAMKYYLRCLSFDPDYLSAHKKIAGIMILRQDSKGAIPHLEKILSIDSLNLYALNMLANIYSTAALNNPQKAASYLQRAQLYGGDTTMITKLNIAMDAFFRQDYEKAIPLLWEYHKADSTDMNSILRLYEYYFRKEDYAQAQNLLAMQIQIDSLNPDVNFNCGYFYASTPAPFGDNKKAIFHFNRAVMVNPYDTVSLRSLMMLYGRERATADMRQVCNRLLQLNPQSYDAHKGLTIIYEIEDNVDAAVQAYMNALKLYPDDEYFNGQFATFLMNTNDSHSPVVASHALVYAKKVVEINPTRSDNHYVLSKAFLTSGFVKDAKKEYEESVKIDPGKRKPDYEKILYSAN